MVLREGSDFRVSGAFVERWVAMTDMDNDEAVATLQRRLRRAGVDDALASAGCAEGDTVHIGARAFVYVHGGVGR